MNDEIYAPPQSTPENKQDDKAVELASRGSRLGASLLDTLIIVVVTMPVLFLTGGFDDFTNPEAQPSFLYNLAITLLGLIVFLLINYQLLTNNGQTIGKKIVGIKIVDNQNNPVTWNRNLLKRYAVYFLPGQIPIIGQIFSLVNILFIFGKELKCIHDILADTKVIRQ